MTAVLIGFTVYSNHRADALRASKITMQVKAEKVRSRILMESDIEKVRHFVVAAHDGSERNFSTIVEMTSDFNNALRYLCMALIAMGVGLGVPIYYLLRGFKDKTP